MAAIAGIRFNKPVDFEEQEMLMRNMLAVVRHRGKENYIERLPPAGIAGGRCHSQSMISQHHAVTPDRQLGVIMAGDLYRYPEYAANGGSPHNYAHILLQCYEKKNVDFLEDIDGSYAIAVWDAKAGKILLARDRVGSRPLFYAQTSSGVLFASEVKAILATRLCQRDVNLPALNRFLSYGYVPCPDTMFSSIKQVRPGHYLTIRGREVSEQVYWTFRYRKETQRHSKDVYGERCLDILNRAVARRVERHPDCGAFLSGGLDTSAVVAAMRQCDTRKFKVFTGAFQEKEYDESPDAKIVADHLGLEHHVVTIQMERNFPSLLKKIVWYHDAPFADTSAIPSYFTAKFAREHMDHVLTGDFPDQLMAGSGHHAKAMERERADNALLKALRTPLVRGFLNRLPLKAGATSLADRIQRMVYRESFPLDERRIILDMPVPELLKRCLYTPALLRINRENDPLEVARSYFRQVSGECLLDRLLYFDTLSYAPDDLMVKVERMTMAHGLNAISPFHDLEFIDFVAGLPPEMKMHGDYRKVALREAIRALLPAATLEKKKKGFDMPIGAWLIKRYPDFVRDILFDRKTIDRGYFRSDFMEIMVNRFLAGQSDYATGSEAAIISLLTLELWHRLFLDGDAEFDGLDG